VLTYRAAAGIDDLAIAEGLISAAWLGQTPTVAATPSVAATPAALEWWHVTSWPDALGDHLRLWFADGIAVAWTWHDTGELEWHVWTGDPERDADCAARIVDTVLAEADGEPVAAWAAEDDAVALALFDSRGFRPTVRRLSQWQVRLDDGGLPPVGPIPDGYRIRSIDGPDEYPARVELHRAAFPGSRLTAAKYERLLRSPHYRFDDDLVIEAPDGTLVAFALAWWDPVARVGEFEPVGTHPDHRRLGLARAALTLGLRRFAERGARIVQVYADAGEIGPDALYETSGFRRRAFHERFEHGPSGPASAPAGPSPDLQSAS
jgi:ribosomal protein S18 acetylase RimI-like enzyme